MSQVDPHGLKTRAVAFAVRAGHTDEMALRFLEALCLAGQLGLSDKFAETLARLVQEESQ